MNEYCFTSLSAQSWQYCDRRKPEAGTMRLPYSYFEWLLGLFIVHITICNTLHSMPLNSLEHCICTTTMTNIRPDRDLNQVTSPRRYEWAIGAGRLCRWPIPVSTRLPPVLFKCWASVYDSGHTFKQHRVNASAQPTYVTMLGVLCERLININFVI